MAARKSKISGTVSWSDGSGFNGYYLVMTVLPTSSGVDWPEVAIGDSRTRTTVPNRAVLPVVDGVFNQNVGLFFTIDLNPPNVKYAAYAFDASLKQVAGPTALFTVTADPTAMPSLTLTVPTAGTVIPSPET